MTLSPAEVEARKQRLLRILKEEGTLPRYRRLLKKGRVDEAVALTEDVIERYGQELKKR